MEHHEKTQPNHLMKKDHHETTKKLYQLKRDGWMNQSMNPTNKIHKQKQQKFLFIWLEKV